MFRLSIISGASNLWADTMGALMTGRVNGNIVNGV